VKLERTCRAAVAALALSATASALDAQTRERPLLIFTTFVGYVGGGPLWSLDRQPALTLTGLVDTLTLGRAFVPGLSLGLGASLFLTPHLGYHVEIAFLGTATESRCEPLRGYVWEPGGQNQRACQDIQGRKLRTNVVAVQGGLTWQAMSSGPVRPYIRAAAGPAYAGGSFIEMAGRILDSASGAYRHRFFLVDEAVGGRLTWVATAAAGVTLEMSPGYQLRFEIRELFVSVPVVTGPADYRVEDAYPSVGSITAHLPSLTLGLDISLERQRRRRY